MQPTRLSKADASVLAQVFDPERGPSKAEVIVDPGLPSDRHITDREILDRLRATERQAVRLIEEYEKSTAKSRDKDAVYAESLSILDQLIDANPDFASARNNRAQLRRWKYGDDKMICQNQNVECRERASAASATLEDLRLAIELASPASAQHAVSPSQGRLLAQSYTQLAALYYAAAKDLDSPDVMIIACGGFEGWTRDRFEEEASRLFYLGGLYGNEVAKALAVHTNPHAKLCGSIVKEAMRKEFAAY